MSTNNWLKIMDNGILGKLKKLLGLTYERKHYLSAEEAYFKSMYGQYMTPEDRINSHQENISNIIKSKCYQSLKGDTDFSSFYCVYDFNDDMKEYIDEVFKPFREQGYTIINLSEKVDEIKRENVYIVSWDKNTKNSTSWKEVSRKYSKHSELKEVQT